METVIIQPNRESVKTGYVGQINSYFSKDILEEKPDLEEIYNAICAIDKTYVSKHDNYYNNMKQSFFMLNGRFLKANLSSYNYTFLPNITFSANDLYYDKKYFRPDNDAWLTTTFIRELHALIITCKVARSCHIDYRFYKDRATILMSYTDDLIPYWAGRNEHHIIQDLVKEFKKEFEKL